MKYLILILFLLLSNSVFAAKPTCYEAHGGYCQYTGKVSRIYINSGNMILFYFDSNFDEGETDKSGVTATNRHAGTVLMSDNPEFAKLFYSTALAAQASKRDVTIQMRGTHGGYMKIDRIWLSE